MSNFKDDCGFFSQLSLCRGCLESMWMSMGFDFFTHPLQTNEFHYAKVLWENEKMWNKK
jgi:hypothetical protein